MVEQIEQEEFEKEEIILDHLLSPRVIKLESQYELQSKVSIEPFERGFGYTLGNALRRVLLSSLPGFAITEVQIDGVLHEYTTIDGVQEDVVEILLNLKNVAINLQTRDEADFILSKKGPGKITAGDIKVDQDVEIVNPESSFLSKEDVTEVVVPAFEGEMGILKDHISIISFLKPGIIKVYSKSEENKYFVEDGIVEFKDNNLSILTSSIYNMSDLDRNKIDKIVKEAEKESTGDNIDAQKRYLIDQKIEVLKSVKLN